MKTCVAGIVLALLRLFPVFIPSSMNAAVITFEDLPDMKFFESTGLNVGRFYPDVTFGLNVTGLSAKRFGGYADTAFPPHSGDVVVWSAFDADTTIAFAKPQAAVGIWYTSFDFLSLTAYDSGDSLLNSALGNPNTDGFVGISNFLSVSAPGTSYVVISGLPGSFVFDDLTFETTAIPEPASGMLIVSAIVALGFRRLRALLRNQSQTDR